MLADISTGVVSIPGLLGLELPLTYSPLRASSLIYLVVNADITDSLHPARGIQ